MYNHILYFYFWLANALVLLLGRWFFPMDVVLGSWRFSPLEAAIYTGFWQTFMVWLFWDFALGRRIDLSRPVVRLVYFYPVNVFSVWLVARFANYSGLGISSFIMAFILGLAGFILQQWVRRRVVAGSSHQ
jgi:hypothetical protein